MDKERERNKSLELIISTKKPHVLANLLLLRFSIYFRWGFHANQKIDLISRPEDRTQITIKIHCLIVFWVFFFFSYYGWCVKLSGALSESLNLCVHVKRIFYYVRRWGQASHEGRWDLMGWFHWLNNRSRPTRFFKRNKLPNQRDWISSWLLSQLVCYGNKNKKQKRFHETQQKTDLKKTTPDNSAKDTRMEPPSYIRPSARLPTTFLFAFPPYSSLMLFISRSSLHLRWLLVRQDWAILCVLGSTGRGHPLKNFHHHLSTQQQQKRVLVIFEKMLRKNE